VAHIRKLPSGKFNAVVRLPNGKRTSITDPLRRVVVQKAADLEAAIRRGDAVHLRERRVTVGQWYDRWLMARSVERNTAKKDKSRWVRYVQPHWETWPLDSISRLDVQTWVKKLSDGGAGSHAVQGAYQLLATLLNDAVDEKLLPASPCRKITLPRGSKPEPRWLTRHEYDRLQMVLGDRPNGAVWQALVGLGCFSGLRPEELCGLDIGHLDFDRGLARVAQVAVINGELRPYAKSDRSRRSVPFPDEVAALLWRITADRTSGPVFTTAKGARVEFANFRQRVWHPALKAAGIEPVRPYVLRHTCCSWLVQAGVSDRRIMKIMGHADAHLIDVYGHLAPDEHDDVRAAWARDAGGTQVTHADGSGNEGWRRNGWSDARIGTGDGARP